MANLTSSVRINNRILEGGIKINLDREQGFDAERWTNAKSFGLRIVHHNVQSLSNKKMR
jgi:hypothetical protein